MDLGAALHLLRTRIVALQDAKNCTGRRGDWITLGALAATLYDILALGGKINTGTGDFCDLRDGGRGRGSAMSFI